MAQLSQEYLLGWTSLVSSVPSLLLFDVYRTPPTLPRYQHRRSRNPRAVCYQRPANDDVLYRWGRSDNIYRPLHPFWRCSLQRDILLEVRLVPRRSQNQRHEPQRDESERLLAGLLSCQRHRPCFYVHDHVIHYCRQCHCNWDFRSFRRHYYVDSSGISRGCDSWRGGRCRCRDRIGITCHVPLAETPTINTRCVNHGSHPCTWTLRS